MADPKWKTLEDQVRGIAALIFGQSCKPGRIAGVNFDGVIERGELETVAIEISQQNTLDKVRQGIGRILLARQTLVPDGVLLRGYIILTREPTNAMLDAAAAAKIVVASVSQFAALFFEFPRYNQTRSNSSFGSSIDPLTGDIDTIDYVPVEYERLEDGRETGIEEVGELLLGGKKVVLLGEYGSGKSRCIRQIYLSLIHI